MTVQHPRSSFDALVSDPQALRGAFSRFATGVTIVTTATPSGPVGMTVNSFSSVSLEPALTLWSVDRKSSRHDIFARATHTAIHVLSRGQEALCLGFARRADAFELADWHAGDRGVPLIEGCLARFECVRYGAHQAGDHTIVVDRILAATMQDGEPLVFSQGTFGTFSRT